MPRALSFAVRHVAKPHSSAPLTFRASSNRLPWPCDPEGSSPRTTGSMQTQQPLLLAPNALASLPVPIPGYLAASKDAHQLLCSNSEGWGPLSPIRYDFTPCFLDVWIAVVATFGIVGGVGALWYLYRNCPPQTVKRNWHFYAKLVRPSSPQSCQPDGLWTCSHNIADTQIPSAHPRRTRCYHHCPGHSTDPVLQRRLGRRLPLLDLHPHPPVSRCHLPHTVH